MSICYEIVCSKRHVEDLGTVRVFGLKAYEEGKPSSALLCCIEDISSDRKFVETLCTKLRRRDVHPDHLKDIVVDSIS